MSVTLLNRYLEQLEWRYNNRRNPHIFRDALAQLMNTKPQNFRDLVA